VADVLVADDNKVNRLLLCRSLELMGHRVSSAENGHQALALLRAQRFDLLLLDLAMPELDGFALLQLRAGDAALREVSVIVTSALDGVAPVARCIELGADDFLHKPVDPWLLKARVDASLARKQQQDRLEAALRRLSPDAPAQASRLADACVLVGRLHNACALVSAQTPQEAMDLLSNWSTLMFDALAGNHGDVTQFCGDGLMALFAEAPAAVRAAQDMVEVTALFNAERAPAGHGPIALGIGIARGAVLAGTATTARRSAFACIGAPVQRAEHLAAECARQGRGLLLDARVLSGWAADGPAAYTVT
jgi:CheY-like chemotaxis protein